MKYVITESQFRKIRRRIPELDNWVKVCFGEYGDCIPWKGSNWCKHGEDYYIKGIIRYFTHEMLASNIDDEKFQNDSEEILELKNFIEKYLVDKWIDLLINSYKKGCLE
jgi:hypothetical protein